MAEQQKEALGRILDHAVNEFYIFNTEDFRFQYVSKAATDKLGYTYEELLQKTPLDIQTRFTRESFTKLIMPLLEGQLKELSLETTHFRKDCTPYPVKVRYQLAEYLGKTVFVAVALDITEEKQAAEEIEQSKRFIESIADTSPELLYVFDFQQDNYIYFSNHIKDMLGYEVEDVISGKLQLFSRLHPDDFAKVAQNFREKIKEIGDDEVLETVYRVKHHNGQWVWLSSRDKPFKRDESGRVIQTVGTAQDITHRMQYERQLEKQNEELKKANAELDRFVYSSSHDLRAPLASVLGLINLALMEDSSQQKDVYIRMMEGSINRLDRFIQDIINYSRNSRMEVSKDVMDFAQLTADTIDNLSYMDDVNAISFSTSFDIQAPFVSDYRRISVIFSNLIGNAIRYRSRSVDQSVVKVKVKTNAKEATILVEDNGVGIDPEYIDKIFDMFFKASNEKHGSGIGLYIVKETVNMLQGSIMVESKTRIGSTFTVTLPNLQD